MRVLIDSQALLHVLGTRVDFVTNRIKYAWSRVCSTECCTALPDKTLLHTGQSSLSQIPTPRASAGVESRSRHSCLMRDGWS